MSHPSQHGFPTSINCPLWAPPISTQMSALAGAVYQANIQTLSQGFPDFRWPGFYLKKDFCWPWQRFSQGAQPICPHDRCWGFILFVLLFCGATPPLRRKAQSPGGGRKTDGLCIAGCRAPASDKKSRFERQDATRRDVRPQAISAFWCARRFEKVNLFSFVTRATNSYAAGGEAGSTRLSAAH